VGYIDDPIVGNKFRLRFESGRENDVPDRVEFFYAKCGCYQDVLIDGAPADPEAPGPRPGAAIDVDHQQMFVQGEVGIGDRVSLFGELPIGFLRPQEFVGDPVGFGNQNGIGDIRAGIKIAAVSLDRHVVSLQLRGFFPTGDAAKGLGTDHAAMEPSLLMFHRAGDRGAIESQVGLWYPFSGASGKPLDADASFAGPIFFYGIGPSVEVYRGPRVSFAPVVELVGWRILDGFQTVLGVPFEADGTNIVNIKVGARLAWDDGGSIYGGWGRALTEQHWYQDIFRLEYRRAF
jgi:hypothetical protein